MNLAAARVRPEVIVALLDAVDDKGSAQMQRPWSELAVALHASI